MYTESCWYQHPLPCFCCCWKSPPVLKNKDVLRKLAGGREYVACWGFSVHSAVTRSVWWVQSGCLVYFPHLVSRSEICPSISALRPYLSFFVTVNYTNGYPQRRDILQYKT